MGTFLCEIPTYMVKITMENKTPITDSDRRLIIRCQKGDRTAFEQLYKRYASDVFSMSLRMVNSEDIAEEVTQETFISIYKNIGRFQFQSAFTTWVYRIVIRRVADYFRKNKKHHKKTVPLHSHSGENIYHLEEPGPSPMRHAQENEREQKIQNAIHQLNEKQRTILILRYMNHLQYEEIAEILGCRVGTVKSRLNRAHKSLESLLVNMDIEISKHF